MKIKNKLRLFLVLGIVVSIALFFLTRLINLTIIPIFTDEAIYLRWAQIALGDPRWRFISLIDGKQPLLIWLFLPVLKLGLDPLVSGRFVSICAGFLAMLGLSIFAGYKTKSMRGALLGAILYLVVPFFLMYDRLAIYEALFICISIWSLFLTYLFGTKLRLDIALLLGTSIGAGLLTKSYANFFLILLPATALLIKWPKKNKLPTFFKWLGLMVVVFIQAQVYNNILRLSEFRHIIDQKNLSFIYSFPEFFAKPFQSVYGNTIGLSTWLIGYLTIPIIVAVVLAFVWYLRKNFKEALFFLIYFGLPFGTLAFFGKVIYPRFLLFMVPPLFIVLIHYIDYLLDRVTYKRLLITLLCFVLMPAVWFDYKIITDPIHAPMPMADKQQFINDWPAGYGIKEVVAYVAKASETQHVIVGTEGTFGLFPMALELYLGTNPNVTFKAYWPFNEFPQELSELVQKQPAYVVFKERQQIPHEWPLKLIAEYQRGDGPTYLRFYQVIPQK